MKPRYAASLSLLAAVVAFMAWGQGLHWHFDKLSNYQLFPLFGVLAYSLLWSTYLASYGKRRWGDSPELQRYYKIVRLFILIFILAHPSLLIWQLWRDGFGLPPGSYLQDYVAPAAKWAAELSSVAFFVFLAYEFKWKFGKKTWWRYVESAGDLAMIAIFFHALRLGTNLQRGWFRGVWVFFGVSLALVLIELYWSKWRKAKLDSRDLAQV